ncbi:WD repeat-containing protein slp1 [Vanrija pseudolonga]|uniref:WD repeat-containing protein slp1 n=1 Tax=Vanrija pseudolonga TaxID=143232 RepID=A0AAF1BIY7_9TREE|nr:WD repeat-containing protein slp1 [Vanrija pseudolonga]
MGLEAAGSSKDRHPSNPFHTRAKVPSPVKQRSVDIDGLAGLREGMGRMNIADRGSGEFVLPEKTSKDKISARDLDRFVPSRPVSQHSSFSHPAETPDTSMDSTHSAPAHSGPFTLAQPGRRILSFRAAPPPASHATSHLDAQRNYLLHSSTAANRGATNGAAAASAAAKKRSPPYLPDRVLDAPGFVDDYYLNLVDWSCSNRVAIGLGCVPYVWDAESGDVMALGEETEESTPVTSVKWSPDGAFLATGNDNGDIEIWDVEESKRMRVMRGHNARIPTLSWNGHVLSSGCRDGTIFHHDVRIAQHKVQELRGHSAEVCGLAWRPDGQLLASGGNDNVVNCWDARVGQPINAPENEYRVVPKWTKRNHTAAVKALAWCPWQSNLLATGGGSQDQHIHFWSTTTGARTSSLHAKSQVTSLIWSPHSKEILSTHGFPDNNISLWSYPSLQKIYDVPAHDNRVLASSLSPDGCTVATGAGDENLKFWKIWEPKAVGKKADSGDREARGVSKVRIR